MTLELDMSANPLNDPRRAEVLLRINRTNGSVEEIGSAQPTDSATLESQPLMVVAGWNPYQRPDSLRENHEHFERLLAEVEGRGWSWQRAVVLAADLRWAEAAVAIEGVDLADVLAFVADAGQSIVYRVDSGTLSVWSTEGQILASTPVTGTRLASRPCPMRPGHQPTMCTTPGGGWTSRSIEVSALFERDRAALVAAAGCDVCHGGRVHGAPGTSILLHEWTVASRYGPPEIVGPVPEDWDDVEDEDVEEFDADDQS